MTTFRIGLGVGVCAAAAIVAGAARTGAAAAATTRTVYVSVLDNKGAAITDLTPADFVVKEGGKEYAATAAPAASGPLQIAIVVDDNGTGVFRPAIAGFVQGLLGKAQFSIVSVLGRVTPVTPLTDDTTKLRDGIMSLVPRPGTQDGAVLLDGVFEVVRAFSQAKAARPVVVVLSVGAMDKSSSGSGEVLREVKQSTASVHVISLSNALVNSGGGGGGNVGSLMDNNVNIQQLLDDGPKQSGGKRVNVQGVPEVAPALAKITDQLLHQYALTYALPDGVKMNERLQVTVKRSGATVLAPSKIADK